MRRLAIAFITAAPLLLAQLPGSDAANPANGFAGPLLGFVLGSTPAELQPILGIPGAARLGNAVPLPSAVTQLYLAPGHCYALAAQGPANPVALLILRLAGGREASPTLAAIARGPRSAGSRRIQPNRTLGRVVFAANKPATGVYRTAQFAPNRAGHPEYSPCEQPFEAGHKR